MRSVSFKTPILIVLAATTGAVVLATQASCLSDPREGDAVSVVSACELPKLSSDPASPESTVKTFAETADALLAEAKAADEGLRAACNALGAELGLPPGSDTLAACQGITTRIETVIKGGTAPFGPGAPEWAELRLSASCKAERNALEACLSKCAGPCDASKCDPTKVVGKCAGECTGECATSGADVPCEGLCKGSTVLMAPSTCLGECEGICINGVWAGQCEASCSTFFIGACGGTCTGQCNGAPINVMTSDAGADAGPPPGGPPPDNAPGNCKGTCVGVCSSGSNGFCNGAPCLKFNVAGPPDIGNYKGYCPGTCAGKCTSVNGTGATTTCNGTCTTRAKSCAGECKGTCSVPMTETRCDGTFRCGQNAECENSCQAQAVLKSACEDSAIVEAFAVSDPVLYAAFKKLGPGLGKAIARVRKLRDALGYVSGRAYGDFVAIGARGDLTRTCVAKANATISEANKVFAAASAADPTIRKVSVK